MTGSFGLSIKVEQYEHSYGFANFRFDKPRAILSQLKRSQRRGTCRTLLSRTRAEINRDNAKRSTGPQSTEGKSRSAKNSTRHGLSKVPKGLVNNLDASLSAFSESEAYAKLVFERAGLGFEGAHLSGVACDVCLENLLACILELERLDRYRTPRLRTFLRASLIALEEPCALNNG